MTLAQKLKSEGRQEGRREGRQEGALNTCLRLAERKWGSLPASLRSRMERLGYVVLEALIVDLSDLGSPNDLQTWLDTREEG